MPNGGKKRSFPSGKQKALHNPAPQLKWADVAVGRGRPSGGGSADPKWRRRRMETSRDDTDQSYQILLDPLHPFQLSFVDMCSGRSSLWSFRDAPHIPRWT